MFNIVKYKEQLREKELKKTNEDIDSQQCSIRTLVLQIYRLGVFFKDASQRI